MNLGLSLDSRSRWVELALCVCSLILLIIVRCSHQIIGASRELSAVPTLLLKVALKFTRDGGMATTTRWLVARPLSGLTRQMRAVAVPLTSNPRRFRSISVHLAARGLFRAMWSHLQPGPSQYAARR